MTSTAPLDLFSSPRLYAPDHRRIDPVGRFARLRWDHVAAGGGRSREQVSLIASHDRANHQFSAMARRVHYDGEHTRALRDSNPSAVAICLPPQSVARYSRDGFIDYVQACADWLAAELHRNPDVSKLFDPQLRVYSTELDA